MTPDQVRAKYGRKCQCRGQCGRQHLRGTCRQNGSITHPMHVVGDLLFCNWCGPRIK